MRLSNLPTTTHIGMLTGQVNSHGFVSGAIQNAVVGAISNQVQAGMNYAFLDQPYTFNWNDFLMQTATSAVVGGITGEIKARHLKSLSRQGNIEKNISLGAENYREKLSSNEIGRIGEQQ